MVWVRRRWLDFRLGHSIYLIFFLSFSNFILISYRLLIEQVPILDNLIPDLWVFMIVFILLYIPVAILIGIWHKRTQVKIESDMFMRYNHLLARDFRIIIEILTKRDNPEEVDKLLSMLKSIEQGKAGKINV